MGYSEAPDPTVLRPTFDDVAMAIDAFIAQWAPGPLILYLHDIGGPIGMRIATAHPERIAGLIFQNTTTSVEGWNPERLSCGDCLLTPKGVAEIAGCEASSYKEVIRICRPLGMGDCSVRRFHRHASSANKVKALSPNHRL